MSIKVGRPKGWATEILAYTGSKWIKDDGKPHRGFSYRDKLGIPVALYFTYNDNFQRTIMEKTCDRFHCANGRNGLDD